MRLGLCLSHAQVLICTLCGRSIEEHLEGCPHLAAKRASLAFCKYDINCHTPACRGKVYPNIDDFYECRRCGTQYSASEIGSDGKKVEYLIDYQHNESYPVHVLPAKGQGRFLMNRQMEVASKAIVIAKKMVKKRREEPLTDFSEVWLQAEQMVPPIRAKPSAQDMKRLSEILRGDDSSFE